jgi:hypothetical protein
MSDHYVKNNSRMYTTTRGLKLHPRLNFDGSGHSVRAQTDDQHQPGLQCLYVIGQLCHREDVRKSYDIMRYVKYKGKLL